MSQAKRGKVMERLSIVIVYACLLSAAIAGIAATSARGELIDIGYTYGDVTLDVPDPQNPGSTREVFFGEMGARMQADPTQMQTVIGFEQTYSGETGFDSLHFLNVVVADPFPPKWKDQDGQYHQPGINETYIDPLNGGNIKQNQQTPAIPADANPWYDGELTGVAASDYGLNIFKEGDFDWTTNPDLDHFFGDAPTLTDGLGFVTILMGVKDSTMLPVAGVAWGRTSDGVNYIQAIFLDSQFPSGLNIDGINDALARSGFTGCKVIPEPAALSLLALGLLGLAAARRGHRRTRRPSAATRRTSTWQPTPRPGSVLTTSPPAGSRPSPRPFRPFATASRRHWHSSTYPSNTARGSRRATSSSALEENFAGAPAQ